MSTFPPPAPPPELQALWTSYQHLFERVHVPARTVLLAEGRVATHAYYIEQGCLRLWFNSQGKDLTFQFFFEGEGVSSVESFRRGQPSAFTLEALEPCVLRQIRKTDLNAVLASSPALKAYFDEQLFERLVYYQRLFLSRLRDTPQVRYEELLARQPHLVQRVAQHYIASYLGITPVSLSRIRNRRPGAGS
jgi:CRP-like cAMP-binding protein